MKWSDKKRRAENKIIQAAAAVLCVAIIVFGGALIPIALMRRHEARSVMYTEAIVVDEYRTASFRKKAKNDALAERTRIALLLDINNLRVHRKEEYKTNAEIDLPAILERFKEYGILNIESVEGEIVYNVLYMEPDSDEYTDAVIDKTPRPQPKTENKIESFGTEIREHDGAHDKKILTDIQFCSIQEDGNAIAVTLVIAGDNKTPVGFRVHYERGEYRAYNNAYRLASDYCKMLGIWDEDEVEIIKSTGDNRSSCLIFVDGIQVYAYIGDGIVDVNLSTNGD